MGQRPAERVPDRGRHLGPGDGPVDTTLSIVVGKWKALILHHLRELEADGIIHRAVFAVVPPRVDYSLADVGRSLIPILEAMAAWGEAHRAARASDARAA